MIDYFFSAEGTLTGKYGFEGNSIVFKELPFADGAEIAVLNYDVENSKYKNQGEFRQQFAMIEGAFDVYRDYWGLSQGLLKNCSDDVFNDIISQSSQILTDNGFEGWSVLAEDYIRNEQFEFAKAMPPLVYTEEEINEASTLITDLTAYFQTSFPRFITGELDVDKDWDAYLDTAKSMGSDRLIKIMQTSYDRVYK